MWNTFGIHCSAHAFTAALIVVFVRTAFAFDGSHHSKERDARTRKQSIAAAAIAIDMEMLTTGNVTNAEMAISDARRANIIVDG